MRTAEILTALGLMALSVFFMAYAVELPIGWDGSSGPGGGAFPFWLSLVMLVCSGAIVAREVAAGLRARAAVARGEDAADRQPWIDPAAFRDVAVVSGALIATVALTAFAGAYVAIVLFLIFYLRWFGGHSIKLTAILTVATPVVVFLFFEATLRILLPKGITEPLFIPLYALVF